jgi:hypothetical protein
VDAPNPEPPFPAGLKNKNPIAMVKMPNQT